MTKEELEFFKGNLGYLFDVHVVFTELRENPSRELGPRLSRLLISSLGRNFLLGLAALIDPPEDKRGNKNLSIFLFEGVDLSPYEPIVKKVLDFRKKLIAHNDRTIMLVGGAFVEESDLKYEEVEGLLHYLINVVENAGGEILPPRDQSKDELVKIIKKFSCP